MFFEFFHTFHKVFHIEDLIFLSPHTVFHGFIRIPLIRRGGNREKLPLT